LKKLFRCSSNACFGLDLDHTFRIVEGLMIASEKAKSSRLKVEIFVASWCREA
jgi:hypothetical protein